MKNSFYKLRGLALSFVALSFFISNHGFAFEGDLNNSGYVDFDDLAVMASKWLVSGCDVNDCNGADINSSGNVNMKDFSLLAGNWNSLDPSLIGWWKFDDLAADQAIDYTGNGNNGILRGGAKKVSSDRGGVLELDGNNDFVEVTNESNFDLAKAFTLAAWFKAYALKTDMKIISKGPAFCLGRDYDYNVLSFSSDSIGRPITGTINVFDFKWHHAAVVYDGATESLYVDGILDVRWPAPGNVILNDENVLIGNFLLIPNSYWWGQIDDVRIYSRALSQEELLSIIRPYCLQVTDMVPFDETDYEPNNITLSWTPGSLATSYDLYFGTDPNEVEIANHSSDVYIGNFPADSNTYDPGILTDGQTYYWRLEHVE